jgi:hypothetical protein
MCVEGLLIPPGHVSHTFLRSSASPQQSTFDPVALFVSAVNLHRKCPPTLLRALADSHPGRKVWLQSYYEEKQGIGSLGIFKKITLGEYRAICKKGAPKAIPTMCILAIKKDENLPPLREKSRTVVLGNHEARVWSKSDFFASVLCQDSLRFLVSLAVEKHRPLCQGDCKNAFVRVFFPLMKSLLSALLLAIQRPIHRNFGTYNALSMAFNAVLATGMTTLMQFSDPLDLLHFLKTLAFTWALFMIPLIHLVQH